MIFDCYLSFAEQLSKEKPPKQAFFELKHENGIKTAKKYALATLHSSDLSLGIHCIFSQSRDTIPLRWRGDGHEEDGSWGMG
jgi:hypothetical protein